MHAERQKAAMNVAGQKGSDVSAREATRKLVAATKQMHALQAVLEDVHGLVALGSEHTGAATERKLQGAEENARSAEPGSWAAKNTIVRDVLNELTNAQKARTRLHRNLQHTSLGLLQETGRHA